MEVLQVGNFPECQLDERLEFGRDALLDSISFSKAFYTHAVLPMIKLMFREVVTSSIMREGAWSCFASLSDCGSSERDLLALASPSL